MKKLIYVLAAVKFVLPFLLQNAVYEPHRDEFLYLAEARHLAWGYLELPPVLSVLSFVTNAFGASLFWIKFWPSLGGALTYVLVGRMILLLGGGRFALLLGFLPFVFGYFLHVHFMLQPNFLEMLAWTLMLYGLMLHVRTGKYKGLYLAGVGFGLGMMSKYSVGFFACSLLLGLFLTPERKVLRNRHFYFSLLAGLLIFLPNLIWEGMHGWPVARQMTELRQQQLDQVSRLNFLLDQLSYNLPGLLIWTAGLYWLFAKPEGKPYRFAGWAVLFVLIFLTAARGKSYYAMSAYPVLFAFGAVYLERVTAAPGTVGVGSLFGCAGLLPGHDRAAHAAPGTFGSLLSTKSVFPAAWLPPVGGPEEPCAAAGFCGYVGMEGTGRKDGEGLSLAGQYRRQWHCP
jgi:4-amino-4-deoxy-L-arabinose transferase-like glycosyltransferase